MLIGTWTEPKIAVVFLVRKHYFHEVIATKLVEESCDSRGFLALLARQIFVFKGLCPRVLFPSFRPLCFISNMFEACKDFVGRQLLCVVSNNINR